jgi:AcrR family transcriptional regulator
MNRDRADGDPRNGLLSGEDSVGLSLVERSTSKRVAVASDEVRRIVAATFEVIAESQSLEPSLREVLRKVRLSTATFYRHFRSRDELLLVVLDEGSAILVSYLSHRVAQESDRRARVANWVEGFLHQAGSPAAVNRTRPFAVGSPRIEVEFPREIRRSVERLVRPLAAEIVEGNRAGLFASPDPHRDAWAIYDLTRSTMVRHLLALEVPTADTTAHLVGLSLRILGCNEASFHTGDA